MTDTGPHVGQRTEVQDSSAYGQAVARAKAALGDSAARTISLHAGANGPFVLDGPDAKRVLNFVFAPEVPSGAQIAFRSPARVATVATPMTVYSSACTLRAAVAAPVAGTEVWVDVETGPAPRFALPTANATAKPDSAGPDPSADGNGTRSPAWEGQDFEGHGQETRLQGQQDGAIRPNGTVSWVIDVPEARHVTLLAATSRAVEPQFYRLGPGEHGIGSSAENFTHDSFHGTYRVSKDLEPGRYILAFHALAPDVTTLYAMGSLGQPA